MKVVPPMCFPPYHHTVAPTAGTGCDGRRRACVLRSGRRGGAPHAQRGGELSCMMIQRPHPAGAGRRRGRVGVRDSTWRPPPAPDVPGGGVEAGHKTPFASWMVEGCLPRSEAMGGRAPLPVALEAAVTHVLPPWDRGGRGGCRGVGFSTTGRDTPRPLAPWL